MSLTWAVFEILGTVAFAFSGARGGCSTGKGNGCFRHCALVCGDGSGRRYPPRCAGGYISAFCPARAGWDHICPHDGGSGVHRFPAFPYTPPGTETCPFCLSCFRYGRSCRFHGDRCDDGDRQLSRLPVCASRSARAHYGGGRRYSS